MRTPRPLSPACAFSMKAATPRIAFSFEPALLSSVSTTHGSSVTKPVSFQIFVILSSLRSGGLLCAVAVKRVLEGLRADAAIGIEEFLARIKAQAEIDIDDRLDRIRHLFRLEAASDDFANRGILVARAAERNLVQFGTLLFHTKQA